MKLSFWVIILPLCAGSVACKGSSHSKEKAINHVAMEVVREHNMAVLLSDSLYSSRAIEAVGNNAAIFGGSNSTWGEMGLSQEDFRLVKMDEPKGLQFRAIAKVDTSVFLVNAGSPAYIYKIGPGSRELVYEETAEAAFYNTIKFWDTERGIITGDPQFGCLSILITEDGGNTWNKVDCSTLPPTAEGEANFAASNTCIDVEGSHAWIATGGKKARIFHSADYGKSWEVFDTPITQGSQMTGIYSVDFYDDKLGIVYGGNWEEKKDNTANKAITKDGGKTWELLSNNQGPGYRSCVKFHPQGNGRVIVAAGSEGIDYSVDQGNTWNRLSNEAFYAFEFSENGDRIWLSGRDRTALGNFVLSE